MTALAGFDPTTADPRPTARTRHQLAQLQGWPDGAIEECERLERLAPEWWTTYRFATERVGLHFPEGFYAVRKGVPSGRPAYAPTAESLLASIRAWPA